MVRSSKHYNHLANRLFINGLTIRNPTRSGAHGRELHTPLRNAGPPHLPAQCRAFPSTSPMQLSSGRRACRAGAAATAAHNTYHCRGGDRVERSKLPKPAPTESNGNSRIQWRRPHAATPAFRRCGRAEAPARGPRAAA